MLHILAIAGVVLLCAIGALVLLGLVLAAAILSSKENPFQ
jgi:hypothetical protein